MDEKVLELKKAFESIIRDDEKLLVMHCDDSQSDGDESQLYKDVDEAIRRLESPQINVFAYNNKEVLVSKPKYTDENRCYPISFMLSWLETERDLEIAKRKVTRCFPPEAFPQSADQ